MKSSLRTRLIVLFVGMLLFSIMSILAINMFFLPSFYQSRKIANMKATYNDVVDACKTIDVENATEEEANKVFDKLDIIGSNANVEVYIVQIEASAVSGDIAELRFFYPYDSKHLKMATIEQLDKYLKAIYFHTPLSNECETLLKEGNCAIYKMYDKRVASNYIELTGSMPGNYWVYLRTNYQGIQESSAMSNQFLLYVGAFVTIFAVIIIFFVGRSFTKPILRLAKHAQRMKSLDFSSRYTEKRKDEIGFLGESMNAMSDKLENTILELKNANNELKLDLERKAKLEQMRQEFLSNVSHELKTPIALIQGYAEGLLDNVNDDPESRAFYCDVIIDEASKMNTTVKRLLSLNQLEFGDEPVMLVHFDLNELIKNVVNSTEILFSQKGIELFFTPAEDSIFVWADEYMIEEVVTNYISNAINHVSNENKIEIKTNIDESNSLVRVSVFNTGEQIPEEEIPKIWSKFYKVDKARTREYGGNGIGLSIVKAIMEAHNQKYGLVNYNNGVEFWFELDIKNDE